MLTAPGTLVTVAHGSRRLVVIADNALLREATSDMLTAEPDMTVIASAARGASGVEDCRRAQPDVVLLDAYIPGESVVRTADAIRQVSSETRIVVSGMLAEPALLRELLEHGVRGYLVSSASRNDIVSTIRAICADDDRIVLHVIVEALIEIAAGPHVADALTRRELQILSLVGEALSNRQISRRLAISEGTVKRHLRSVFNKLDARTRLDAVQKATAVGLLESQKRNSR